MKLVVVKVDDLAFGKFLERECLDLPLCVNFVPKFTQQKPTNFGRTFTYLEDPGMFSAIQGKKYEY